MEERTAGSVVLAGGGELGIAWETGIAAGLLDAGVDLRRASLLVGTSAGAVVGSRLAAGVDPRAIADRLAARTRDRTDSARQMLVEPEQRALVAAAFAQLLERWGRGDVGGSTMTEIGRYALEASPLSEEAFVAALTGRLRIGEQFPDRLLVTTVDTADGELVVLDSGSGAPLGAAVAASCAVPGLFPPVSVDGRRLMDGGVRSVTNADLALRSARPGPVLIVTLLSEDADRGMLFKSWARRLERELAELEHAGFEPHVLRAGPEELEAIGPNPMDSTRATEAAAAGRARGRLDAVEPAFDAWRV